MNTPRAPSPFLSADRLRRLVDTVKVSWEAVSSFAAAFPVQLGQYQEFSVPQTGSGLGVMTRGEGPGFTSAVLRYLQRMEVEQSGQALLHETAEQFGHRRLFVKVEIGPGGAEELSWYIRRRPPLPVALDWAKRAGVEQGLDLVVDVASLLRKPVVHFIAVSERPHEARQVKLYFSLPEQVDAFERMREAARLLGVGRMEWEPLERHRRELAGLTSFLSLGFVRGALVPGVKIDIHDLQPPVVTRILAETGVASAAERLRLLLALSGKEKLDYAGFRLTPGRMSNTKIYAYPACPMRSKAGPDESQQADDIHG